MTNNNKLVSYFYSSVYQTSKGKKYKSGCHDAYADARPAEVLDQVKTTIGQKNSIDKSTIIIFSFNRI